MTSSDVIVMALSNSNTDPAIDAVLNYEVIIGESWSMHPFGRHVVDKRTAAAF